MDSRVFVRILIVVVGVVPWIALGLALFTLKSIPVATLTTIAAAAAVTASVVSAWNGQRVTELQQEAQRPYPYPSIDASSRYQLLQLRVTNLGGTAAHDISLEWEDRPLDFRGRPIGFSSGSGASEIAVLLPGHSVSTPINTDSEFFKKYENANYEGEITFKDASGKRAQHKFFMSAEQYRQATGYEEEEPRTLHELQNIPKELKNLTQEVTRLRMLLQGGSRDSR